MKTQIMLLAVALGGQFAVAQVPSPDSLYPPTETQISPADKPTVPGDAQVPRVEPREPARGFLRANHDPASSGTKQPNSAVLQKEMEAKERLLLFQKLGEYEERGKQGDLPRLRSDADFNKVELARQRLNEAQARNEQERQTRLQLRQDIMTASGRTELKSETNETAVAAPAQPATAVASTNTPPTLTPVGRASGAVLKSKQERLAELFDTYQAGRVTQRQYRTMRAYILAEP